MLFQSLPFFLFLLLVFLGRDLLKRRARKLSLLAASYVFYFWGAPQFGVILIVSTAVSWLLARAITKERQREGAARPGRRKLLLALGCVLHLGLLAAFKYLGALLALFGLSLPSGGVLGILNSSPLGISFFTFAIVGYLTDVYRGKLEAERNIGDYALFVAFFPCLLAGPIGRARDFLPQLKEEQPFDLDRRKYGILRFLFGMLQKMVVADNLAIPVNVAFGNPAQSPLTWIAVLLIYPLQIYFDFAGYSNMAIGVAEALGFRVTENFRAPYLSFSVRSFWKKWHISLTSWLREYLYFPLGGSRRGELRTCLNILIVFAVSGLWHGAALHYVLWGLLNGLLQVAERLLDPLRQRMEARIRRKPALFCYRAWCMVRTYLLMAVTWLLFRAGSLSQIRQIGGQLFGFLRTGFGRIPFSTLGVRPLMVAVTAVALGLCTVVDVRTSRGQDARPLAKTHVIYYAAALLLALAVAFFGVYGSGFDAQAFVYFKY